MQEKKEADFRYGLVRVRENAESIAFYGGEENELQLLIDRFKRAFENLSVSSFLMELCLMDLTYAFYNAFCYSCIREKVPLLILARRKGLSNFGIEKYHFQNK